MPKKQTNIYTKGRNNNSLFVERRTDAQNDDNKTKGIVRGGQNAI